MEKRKKRKQNADTLAENPWKPNPTEVEVATYMYKKLPTKEARLSGMIVRVFHAEDAVSLLMDSPWSILQSATQGNSKKAKPCLFPSQDATISFLNALIEKQMFHRAIRVIKSKVPRKRREDSRPLNSKSLTNKKSSSSTETKSGSEKETPASSNAKPNANDALTDANSADRQSHPASTPASDESKDVVQHSGSSSTNTTNASSSSITTTNKSSKPMKIEMSDEQLFVMNDPQSVYVWVYEPPPGLFTWLAGSALLVGIILCCLFPIWPTQLRAGAYYLTVLASALFGLLIVVALLRLCLYLLCWFATLGKYAFWLFPNYFEDCGFFESFRPIYSWTPILTPAASDKDPSLTGDSKRKAKTKSTKHLAKTEPDRSITDDQSSMETRIRSNKEEVGKVD